MDLAQGNKIDSSVTLSNPITGRDGQNPSFNQLV